MPWIAPVIAGIGAIGGGIAGNVASSNAQNDAQRLIQQSIADYERMGVPTVQAQQLALEKYKSAGLLTPEMEQTLSQGPTEMNKVSVDPNLKSAQLNALAGLGDISNSGGMTLMDQANLEKTLGESATRAKGAREAILAHQSATGGMGGGAGLAAQLQNQQAATQQQHSDALSVAGDARQRALQALLQGGNMATQMRGQAFGEQAQTANAQDLINKFNTGNSQAVLNQNTNRANAAQQFNLQNNQNIANSNVDMSNKEQTYNKGLYQQQFNNQMNLNQAKANARAGQASNLNASAQRASDAWGNVGSGISKAATAYGMYQNSQPPKPPSSDDDYNAAKNKLDDWQYGSNQ